MKNCLRFVLTFLIPAICFSDIKVQKIEKHLSKNEVTLELVPKQSYWEACRIEKKLYRWEGKKLNEVAPFISDGNSGFQMEHFLDGKYVPPELNPYAECDKVYCEQMDEHITETIPLVHYKNAKPKKYENRNVNAFTKTVLRGRFVYSLDYYNDPNCQNRQTFKYEFSAP